MSARARSRIVRAAWAALATSSAACQGPSPSAFEVRFAESALRDRASTVEVAITEGSCAAPGRTVYGPEVFAVDAEGARPPALSRTPHAIHARARDASCTVFAEACVDVDLGAQGEAPVIVTVSASAEHAACDAASCRAGVCDDGDAATPLGDAGLDAPPCPGAGVVFCEDFEHAELAQWTREGSGMALLSTSEPGRPDTQVLYAAAGASEAYTLRTSAPLRLPRGPIYVRFWERFGGTVATETNHKLFYLELGEPDTAPRYFFGASNSVDHGDGVFLAYTDGSTTLSTGASSSLPVGTWVCVSMSLPFDGANTFSLDSQSYGPPDGSLSRVDVPTANVVLGIDNRMGDAMSVYLDDLEIGSMPLPCP